MSKKGNCAACGKERSLVWKNHCSTCYDILRPPQESVKRAPFKKKPKITQAIEGWPRKIMIPVWTTSDGKEWGNEIDALREQLSLERSEMIKIQRKLEKQQ